MTWKESRMSQPWFTNIETLYKGADMIQELRNTQSRMSHEWHERIHEWVTHDLQIMHKGAHMIHEWRNKE